MDFIKRIMDIFAVPEDPKERAGASARRARERLQIILAHDRTDISPELLETLRYEIIKTLKKYMDIDESRIEIDIEEGGMALAVNVPVIQVRRGSHLEGRR